MRLERRCPASSQACWCERMALIRPFADYIQALKDKDAKLYARISHHDPATFRKLWQQVHPEDYPQGGQSLPHRSSIVPREEVTGNARRPS